jgi:hypothetical protein
MFLNSRLDLSIEQEKTHLQQRRYRLTQHAPRGKPGNDMAHSPIVNVRRNRREKERIRATIVKDHPLHEQSLMT